MFSISVLPKSKIDSRQHISSFVSLALPSFSSGTRQNHDFLKEALTFKHQPDN